MTRALTRKTTTPLGAVARGLAAGAAGTAAMTAYQTAVMKIRGTEGSDVPGQVAKKIGEGVLERDVPEHRMDMLNNAMHWTYGTSWGALYGVVQSSLHARPGRHGLLFGALVWGASLLHLPAMKLAPPVWEYPPTELALDVSYHLVYGVAVAGAYAKLANP